MYWKAPMTGWYKPLEFVQIGWNLFEIQKKGGMHMTDYEIISVFLGILALLLSSGSLIVAFLAFLERKNKRK
jgi:hypothetical protein